MSVFDYRATKDGKVFISHEGRDVTTLRGGDAARFLDRVRGAGEDEAQLAMAKATGFLSSVRRPGSGRSALTLSFDELDFESKTQRLRGSVIQVFRGVRPDESDPKMPVTTPYRGLTPLTGVLVEIPGTVSSVDGKEVRLLPGTILRVRLDQPITIRVPGL